MEPADYDAWYRTRRGAWIGEHEFRLLRAMLDPRPGETLPAGGAFAQSMEPLLSPWWPFASFIAVAGDVVPQSN